MLKNTALILIDLQNDYFTGGKCELYNSELAVKKAKIILEYFRKYSLPIIHIKHLNTTMQKEAPYFIPETEGVEIHQLVYPKENENVIIKHTPNSFFQTDLNNELSKKEINNLIVCGMMSHMCIDTTVRHGKLIGYNITVIEDACTSPDLNFKENTINANTVHQVIMASLNGAFANIFTADEWIKTQNNIK